MVIAARLRTLPLSISGIIVGTALANLRGFQDSTIFFLAILTTIAYQITSNFANDYGDGVKGTDAEDRIGPKRALQSGLLTKKELKYTIIVSIICSLILTVLLVVKAFGTENLAYAILFIFLGILSVWAAIKYTIGDSPYGYRGLGDVFVFLFFGLVSVLGSYFLFTMQLPSYHVFGAISIGVLATLVLHLNNMRDRESDAKVGKNTLAVHLGKAGALRYHNILLGAGVFSWLAYLWFSHSSPFLYASALGFLPLTFHFIKIRKTEDHRLLDPQLKVVALSTFLLAVLYFTISFI